MVITGGSGSGKTTLLRSLAQLWPFTSGTLRRPRGRHHVPVPASVRAAGRSACGGLLSRRGRQVLRRRDPVRPRHRVTRAPGQPARRGGRLGEDPLARRAAADRVRPCAAGQAEGGLPRRVDVRARRRSGVRAVPGAAHASCRTASWSASVIVPRSNSTTTGGSNCSATAAGGSRRSRPAPRVFRRGDRRTSLRPTGFRSNSPCRPARCSTRTRRRRTTQESSSRLRAALRRRSRRSVRPW